MRALELKVPPVLLAAVSAGAMWILARAAEGLTVALPYGKVLATVLGAAGIGVAALGVTTFRRARTTVNPVKPDAASSLVTEGIYRYSRNPMYLGIVLVLLGWAAFLANAAALAVVPAFVAWMDAFQIAPEERALAAKFGAAFSGYREKVRRWI